MSFPFDIGTSDFPGSVCFCWVERSSPLPQEAHVLPPSAEKEQGIMVDRHSSVDFRDGTRVVQIESLKNRRKKRNARYDGFLVTEIYYGTGFKWDSICADWVPESPS